MIDDPARRGDLPEGLSFMTFLPARRLVRWLAQTLDPRRLFQPVTRRRLAAIRAVQSEPALKFSDMRFQSRDLGRLRRDQRNQLFPRWLGWRSRIHRILESNPDSDVQKNLRARLRQTAYPTWAETFSAAPRRSGRRQGSWRDVSCMHRLAARTRAWHRLRRFAPAVAHIPWPGPRTAPEPRRAGSHRLGCAQAEDRGEPSPWRL